MSDPVRSEDKQNYIAIRMDDGKANALSFAMLDGLREAVDAAEATGKPLLIAGRPGRFSAGFDLTVMAAGGDDRVRLLRAGAELSTRLLACPVPVVLAVTGHALAMGALLCLSADYRIGVRGAYKIGLNEVAIGMTLPWFGIELARSRLEESHLSRAVGLAHIYDPDSAVDASYLDECLDEAQLDARVDEFMAGLAGLDMAAHRGTKLRLREDFLARLETALARDFGEAGAAATN